MGRKVQGIANGGVHRGKFELYFTLTLEDGSKLDFTAEYGPASQVVGALGRLFSELQRAAAAAEGSPIRATAAEKVGATLIEKDRWSNAVLLQLTTPQGVPYTFELSPQHAAEMADRLRVESAKPHQVGHA